MAYLSSKEISELNHLYKINLVNSCSGYKSANLIGTKSTGGITNVAVFSSVIHLGSEPPLLGFILRPTTVPRNTYKNIIDTGVYTINHINEVILEDAHHTSAKYDQSISEFNMTNLEEEYLSDFEAPFVKNTPIKLGMRYLEEYDIKANGTKMVIGKIEHLHFNDELLRDDGFLNLSGASVATINGLDGYCIPNLKKRFPYQRPKNP